MGKGKGSRRKIDQNENSSEEPVLNLTIDGSFPDAEVRETVSAVENAFQTPCSINGLMAGLSGGSLGCVFGFAGYWMKHRLKGNFKASLGDGWASGKTFALMGGLYAAVSCFMLRLRQKQDAWNGAVSGCATGLALGWSGGPASALQSCVMLGAFSYFLDGMGVESAAQAASQLTPPPLTSDGRCPQQHMARKKEEIRSRQLVEMFLTPALPLYHALQPCRQSSECTL